MRSTRGPCVCLLLAVCACALHPGVSAEEGQEEGRTPKFITAEDRITLNLENEDITAVLRLLSEAKQVNIVASPEVSGSVTINLYDAPFDEALTAILGVAGFTHYRLGEIIYVTTEAKKAELPPDAQDLAVRSFTIDHAEIQEVYDTVKFFMSPSGDAVLSSNRQIVVRDSPHYLEVIAEIIEQLDQPPRQVLITAQIINVDRDDNLDIGVGFDTLPLEKYGVEAIAAGFAGAFPPLPDTLGEFSLEELPTTSGLHLGTLQADSRFFIEALNETSEVDILAAPKILVLDGSVARIQVGDRLGFRITTTTETASLESVEFLEVGTVLEVTPHISGDGLIRLEIAPKVSTGTVGKEGLPTESTTELETNMLVRDGQTIVIGGLLNATKQRVRWQIPFLGDIPLLGRLFGHTRWIDDRSEVIVLIRSDIVAPSPTPEMLDKIEGAKRKWGDFPEEGLVNKDSTPVKKSPPWKWRRLFKRRGFLVPNSIPGRGEDDKATVEELTEEVIEKEEQP